MVTAVLQPPDVATYMPRGGCMDFYTAREPEVLVVGPAGTGKTLAACWKLHHTALRVPGVRLLMVRKVLEDLKAGALATYTNQIKPQYDNVRAFGGNRFYPGEFRYDNGSVIQVVGMDKPGKVMSAEYDQIYVNEATELTEEDWESLKSRLRNGALSYQQLIGDCNPAGPRHWLRVRCDKGLTRYIQTTHKDNPAYWDEGRQDWTPMGLSYVQETLAGLTGIRRKRLFEGVWVAAEGVVYPDFDFQTNVKVVDCTGWRTILGGDIGARNPTALLTIRRSGDGRTHIERERYQRNMGADDITDAICEEMDRSGVEVGWLDPSAKAYIDACVLRGYNVKGANNDVKHGIGVVTTAFADGLTVDPACVNTIAEFESYAWQEGATEKDAPIKQNDHAMDGIRYALVGDSVLQPEIRVW
jgi:PBSX family phage terminase large subunit